jgi:hypothetical protein
MNGLNGLNGLNGMNTDFCIVKVNEINEDALWFLFREFLL